jgi:serine protease Do
MFNMPADEANQSPPSAMKRPARRRIIATRARWGISALTLVTLLSVEAYQLRDASAAQESGQAQKAPIAVLPSFSGLVERVAPSVVSIRVKANPAAIAANDEDGDEQSADKNNPFGGTPLERFFQGPKMMPSQRSNNDHEKAPAPVQPIQGQGSGFFISSDGYIVTNNHVVEGAIKVEVVTDTGDILQAKVIGTDPGTDLALIKVDGGQSFPAVALGRSDVKVGDWVIALGNPFGLEGTVTAGIVSARGRDIGMGSYDNFIQIDAPVNKGNSGGPTFNQAGEVVGVNTAIFSPSGGSVGIAFAIPAKTVEAVVAQLKDKGHVTRGWLGVQVQAVTPEIADSLGLKAARGALVSTSAPRSPADYAGIRRGDVILKINDGEVKDSRDLARTIASIAPESAVHLAVLRDGKRQTVDVKLAELQDETKPKLPLMGSEGQTEIGSLGLSVAPAGDVKTGADGGVKTGADGGVAVLGIRPDGRAADVGLVQGDIIVNANGTDLSGPPDLENALNAAKKAGKKHILALVQRGASQLYVALPTDLA